MPRPHYIINIIVWGGLHVSCCIQKVSKSFFNVSCGLHGVHLDPVGPMLVLWTFQPKQYPDSKVHRTNMGPTWDRQDPGGPHVGHMKRHEWLWWMRYIHSCFPGLLLWYQASRLVSCFSEVTLKDTGQIDKCKPHWTTRIHESYVYILISMYYPAEMLASG